MTEKYEYGYYFMDIDGIKHIVYDVSGPGVLRGGIRVADYVPSIETLIKELIASDIGSHMSNVLLERRNV